MILRFLLTEVHCGLTFANIARSAKPAQTDKIERNIRNAWTAYNTVLRFRHRFQLDSVATAELNCELEQLRTAIQALVTYSEARPHRLGRGSV